MSLQNTLKVLNLTDEQQKKLVESGNSTAYIAALMQAQNHQQQQVNQAANQAAQNQFLIQQQIRRQQANFAPQLTPEQLNYLIFAQQQSQQQQSHQPTQSQQQQPTVLATGTNGSNFSIYDFQSSNPLQAVIPQTLPVSTPPNNFLSTAAFHLQNKFQGANAALLQQAQLRNLVQQQQDSGILNIFSPQNQVSPVNNAQHVASSPSLSASGISPNHQQQGVTPNNNSNNPNPVNNAQNLDPAAEQQRNLMNQILQFNAQQNVPPQFGMTGAATSQLLQQLAGQTGAFSSPLAQQIISPMNQAIVSPQMQQLVAQQQSGNLLANSQLSSINQLNLVAQLGALGQQPTQLLNAQALQQLQKMQQAQQQQQQTAAAQHAKMAQKNPRLPFPLTIQTQVDQNNVQTAQALATAAPGAPAAASVAPAAPLPQTAAISAPQATAVPQQPSTTLPQAAAATMSNNVALSSVLANLNLQNMNPQQMKMLESVLASSGPAAVAAAMKKAEFLQQQQQQTTALPIPAPIPQTTAIPTVPSINPSTLNALLQQQQIQQAHAQQNQQQAGVVGIKTEAGLQNQISGLSAQLLHPQQQLLMKSPNMSQLLSQYQQQQFQQNLLTQKDGSHRSSKLRVSLDEESLKNLINSPDYKTNFKDINDCQQRLSAFAHFMNRQKSSSRDDWKNKLEEAARQYSYKLEKLNKDLETYTKETHESRNQRSIPVLYLKRLFREEKKNNNLNPTNYGANSSNNSQEITPQTPSDSEKIGLW